MEARTLPLDIWRMRESTVLLYVFQREFRWRERERERERERDLLYKIAPGPQIIFYFLFFPSGSYGVFLF